MNGRNDQILNPNEEGNIKGERHRGLAAWRIVGGLLLMAQELQVGNGGISRGGFYCSPTLHQYLEPITTPIVNRSASASFEPLPSSAHEPPRHSRNPANGWAQGRAPVRER